MYNDPEINALSNIFETLKGLDNDQIGRIINWVTSKFELDKPSGLEVHEREVEASPQPVTVEVEPVKKRRIKQSPTETEPTVETPAVQPVMATGLEGFMKFDSLTDVFNASIARRIGQKILLAAAYLQEKENFKELSSYDISSRLRKIGIKLNNASVAINGLMSKKPPLLLQTGTQGTGLKSRRKFRVTEEGLKTARDYITE